MPDFETAHHLNGWPTPSKRFRFRGEWKNKTKNKYQEKLKPIPELPDHFESIDSTDSIHPFRLITSPAHNFLNTSFTETTTSKIKECRPEILLTSMDAAALMAVLAPGLGDTKCATTIE